MSAVAISKAEKSYIQAGLLANPPSRADGRQIYEFRGVALETGVAPLANGSARVAIGKSPHEGGGGTEILAATKLEVENVQESGSETGRVVCTVSCSPAAYPHISAGALDDLQQDMTTLLQQIISHPSLHPSNLGIIPKKKAWLLNLDAVVLADAGNVYDVLFMAVRAALWDTKVPRTRSIEYKARKTNPGKSVGTTSMDVDEEVVSGFSTQQIQNATDFELTDYWDEGEILSGRQNWPVCITLNLVAPVHFLDALSQEEAATPVKLLALFSFPPSAPPMLQGFRTLGSGEVQFSQFKDLLSAAESHARKLFTALDIKLKDEEIRRNQRLRDRFSRR